MKKQTNLVFVRDFGPHKEAAKQFIGILKEKTDFSGAKLQTVFCDLNRAEEFLVEFGFLRDPTAKQINVDL